jgi:signal peptidase I
MRNIVREFIITLAITLVIFLVLRLVIGSYAVISQTMEPGMEIGQRLLINKAAYTFSQPQRGDIVYFSSPDGTRNQMKRIIGLPGDVIEIQDGTVSINGIKLSEPYVANPAAYTLLPYQVPPENYFILGDNRNNSNDSSAGWTVPRDNIQGKAWIFTWPPVKWGSAGNVNLSSQLSAQTTSPQD